MASVTQWLADTSGKWNQKARGTGGSLHVYGLSRKTTTGPETAGTYNTTEILGFNVLNVGDADSWVLTYVDGGVSTIGFGDMREGYFPAHLTSIVIPANGVAEVFIP